MSLLFKSCLIFYSIRYGSVSETEVTHQDLTSFESRWNRPVLKVRYQPSSQQQQRHQQFQQHSQANPNEIAFVLNLICDQLWCHRQQQQQSRLQQQPPSSSSAAPPSLPLQSAEI